MNGEPALVLNFSGEQVRGFSKICMQILERWQSGRMRTLGRRVVIVRWLLGSNPSLSVLLRPNAFALGLRSNFVLALFSGGEEEHRCEAPLEFLVRGSAAGREKICMSSIFLEASIILIGFTSVWQPIFRSVWILITPIHRPIANATALGSWKWALTSRARRWRKTSKSIWRLVQDSLFWRSDYCLRS